MTARHRPISERGQLDLFHALPGDFAPRDAQDLMAYPFFSLAKSHRTAPIDFVAGNVSIRVEAVPDHGMATIWDADILIWAASQIVEARDAKLRTSRLMAATPYEILTFVGRGTSLRDYQRLKAALDRLQSTTVATSIRQPAEGRRHRFSWINEWQERTDRRGKPAGIELIVPDWFYRAVLDDALVLTIDRTYFDLTGGLEALALSPGAEAWRQAARRLALRRPPSPPEIRQPLPVQTLRLRAARHRPSAAAARLHALHRGRDRRSRPARLRAGGALCASCGKPRAIGNPDYRAIGNRRLVLSGTQTELKSRQPKPKSRP